MERRNKSETKMSGQDRDETTPLTGKSAGSVVRATACSRMQAPLQCYLRPAMWIPGMKRLHSHREVWRSENSVPEKNLEAIQRALVKVIETDKTHSDFVINKAESSFLQIFVFTRVEWLDVIEMWFENDQVNISAFSSGFLPLFLPGACILNLAFFWVPFLDMGMNAKRLKWILAHLDVPMERYSV